MNPVIERPIALTGSGRLRSLPPASSEPLQRIGGEFVNAMRKKSIVISGIGCACLAIAVIVYGAIPRAHVSVRKKVEVSLGESPFAYVDAKVDSGGERNDGDPFRLFLESVIDESLKKTEWLQVFDETKAEVIVKCRYRYGLCLPYPSRNFKIHWSSINWLNLTLIDRKSGMVLGEAEFQRPLLAKRPTDDLIDQMFEGMAIKVHDAPLTSATPETKTTNTRPEPPK